MSQRMTMRPRQFAFIARVHGRVASHGSDGSAGRQLQHEQKKGEHEDQESNQAIADPVIVSLGRFIHQVLRKRDWVIRLEHQIDAGFIQNL
jgi:hypothetical protein